MLTAMAVKSVARSFGADAVGISPVSRFANAPVRMSPQGHLPTAKSVVVSAVHIPDTCLELGGEPVPHNWGTGHAGGLTNALLEQLAFRLAKFIEREGYRCVPIPQTAIWRYQPHKELDNYLTPDLSHIHAAAAAGLGEIGYHGLLLTPEYGDRVRLVTVITEAELEPDPLYAGPALCDRCMLCVKHCTPSDGLRKEVHGLTRVDIGGRIFEYANKNKLRCAWAERFQLSYDLDIPAQVGVDAIVPLLADKREGWGSACEPCWRYCLPPQVRATSDRRKTPVRRSLWQAQTFVDKATGTEVNLVGRRLADEIVDIARRFGVDLVGIAPVSAFEGIVAEPGLAQTRNKPWDPAWAKTTANPRDYLPEAATVIALGVRNPKGARQPGSQHYYGHSRTTEAVLKVLTHLEDRGLPAIAFSHFADNYGAMVCGLGRLDQAGNLISEHCPDGVYHGSCIITSATLPAMTPNWGLTGATARPPSRRDLTDRLRQLALASGADLFGVAPVERFAGLREQLVALYDEKDVGLDVADAARNMGGHSVSPKITRGKRGIRVPTDCLPGARNVIVVGVSFPAGIVDRTGQPPAEAVGPYSMFGHHCSGRIAGEVAFDLAKLLSGYGYSAVPVADLCLTASRVAHTFGSLDDLNCSRYAAILAGLGEIGWHGSVITPEFGIRQRFFSVVTDAPLDGTPLYTGAPLCDGCRQCVSRCPVAAIASEGVTITLAGKTWTQGRMDRLRCDWSKRYAFIGDEGPKHMGCTHDIRPPAEITGEAIAAAMAEMDPLQKRIPCIAEPCLLACQRHSSVKA